MLVLLKKEKKNTLIEYCVERYGMPKNIFKNYNLYEGSKNKIYLIKKLINLKLVPESSGLCVFRFDKTPKPTTNFLQLFSADIHKNILDIGEKDLINYCKGNDLQMHVKPDKLEQGFIAIRYSSNIIGCAHWNKITVKNLLPKSKRCKINYC